ncbi:MAG: WXG100 family type VII secretion target [Lachnospiraceae bacterium]|jgi:WXG100 family type VII secretion target|nr:WXG100 family type VII secretion target [Lachnospiraceae bacterium]
MAERISINVEVASGIYTRSLSKIDQLREEISSLMTEIERLETDGEWRGASASKFFGQHYELKPKFTSEFPDALTQLAENLNTNLQNLVTADQANA